MTRFILSDQQKIPTLIAFQVSEFQVIVDPKLYEWALYTSTSKLQPAPKTFSSKSFAKVESTTSDIGTTKKGGGTIEKSLRTETSDRETRKPSARNVESSSNDVEPTLSKRALAFISTWFPTLNAALVQVIQLFLNKKLYSVK